MDEFPIDESAAGGDLPPVVSNTYHRSQRILPSAVPQLLDQATEANQQQRAATVEQAQAEAARRAEQARLVEEFDRQRQDEEAAAIAAMDAENARIAAADELVREQQRKLEGASFRDYWADKSTGDKIMAGVAVFLGGLRGGENRAWEMMKHAMDSDRAMQVARIRGMNDNLVRALTGKSSAVAAKMSLLKELDARAGAGMRALDMKLKAMAAVSPDEVKAKVAAANAKLEQEMALSKARIMASAAPTESTGTSMRPPSPGERAAAASSEGFPVFDASGTQEIARIKDRKAWEESRKFLVDAGSFAGIADDLVASLRKDGKALLDQVARGERDAPLVIGVGKLNQIMRGGILGDKDSERYSKLLEGAIYHSPERAIATIVKLRGIMKREVALQLSGLGIDGRKASEAYMGSVSELSSPESPARKPTARPATAPKAPAPAKQAGAPSGSEQGTVVELKDKKTGEIVRARKIPDASRPAGYRLERL